MPTCWNTEKRKEIEKAAEKVDKSNLDWSVDVHMESIVDSVPV